MKNYRGRTSGVIVVLAALLAACNDDSPPEPVPTTAAPSSSSTDAVPGAALAEVSEPSDSFGQLTDVRVGEHDGFDRVVLEFADAVPGYTVKYVDLPVVEDGSGDPLELPGAEAAVQIILTPASAFDFDAGKSTYKATIVENDKTAEIISVVKSGDFESVLSWAVGLRQEVPFKVTKLGNPARLVVDFQTG